MIDRAHHDPSYNPGVEHRQGHLGGQGEYYDNSSIPAASGPGGFASQQQSANTGYGPTGQYGTVSRYNLDGCRTNGLTYCSGTLLTQRVTTLREFLLPQPLIMMVVVPPGPVLAASQGRWRLRLDRLSEVNRSRPKGNRSNSEIPDLPRSLL